MHTFIKKLFVSLAVIFSITAATAYIAPTPTYAECRPLLGLQSWDCNLQAWDSETNLTTNIAIIASNVLIDISVIATYLVIGYVIYGGYLYIFSSGDTGRVATGKKTLVHAFTGLAIVMLANVVFNTIRIALLGAGGSFADSCIATSSCVDAPSLVVNLLNWFIGSAGAVALAFVFIGGVSYITSSGDSAKLQKAKNTITYALIGLAIVALSLAITAFVSNIIRDADTTSYYQSLTIANK